jgi:DNA-directed RNA polymerase II subunit RPB11
LIAQTVSIKQQFMEQAKNIDIGIGPDQGSMGMGLPMAGGMGGYDPYGDGLGSRTTGQAAGGGGDVYDF